jgi:hypothetical protein
MARETVLRVIASRRLHRGLSGWRSLSAKTRVNLGLSAGGAAVAKTLSVSPWGRPHSLTATYRTTITTRGLRATN